MDESRLVLVVWLDKVVLLWLEQMEIGYSCCCSKVGVVGEEAVRHVSNVN